MEMCVWKTCGAPVMRHTQEIENGRSLDMHIARGVRARDSLLANIHNLEAGHHTMAANFVTRISIGFAVDAR